MTSSVTVCSTWMRVFISRKKYSPSRDEQALDRPRAAVADRTRGVDRDRADALPQLGVDRRRRRLLDELLVAALDRAVALAEVDDVAVPVGEHLHLDVARILEVALDVDGRRPVVAGGRVLLPRDEHSYPGRAHRPPKW